MKLVFREYAVLDAGEMAALTFWLTALHERGQTVQVIPIETEPKKWELSLHAVGKSPSQTATEKER